MRRGQKRGCGWSCCGRWGEWVGLGDGSMLVFISPSTQPCLPPAPIPTAALKGVAPQSGWCRWRCGRQGESYVLILLEVLAHSFVQTLRRGEGRTLGHSAPTGRGVRGEDGARAYHAGSNGASLSRGLKRDSLTPQAKRASGETLGVARTPSSRHAGFRAWTPRCVRARPPPTLASIQHPPGFLSPKPLPLTGASQAVLACFAAQARRPRCRWRRLTVSRS